MPLKSDWTDGEDVDSTYLNSVASQVNDNTTDLATAYRAGGTDVALADGGTGSSLTDPNADRIMFWDDSAGAVAWLTPGTNLSISGTTINASGSGGGGGGTVDALVEGDNVSIDATDPANPIVSVPTVATRVVSTTSSPTPAIDLAATDLYIITAQSVDFNMTTSLTGTGAATDGQPIMVRITDNGSAHNITWGASWHFVGMSAPSTTVAGKTMYIAGLWNDTANRVDVLALSQEA